MKDFPQELVDQVVDELFAVIGSDNLYHRLRGGSKQRDQYNFMHPLRISDYSLVSRAWVNPTQKHHFSNLRLSNGGKWAAHIPPDPAGVSRHVRNLVLDSFYPTKLEPLKEHLGAFTRVESLTLIDCGEIIELPFVLEWFQRMGSSLVDLCINNSQAPSRTVTSLLAALPLLKTLEIHDFQALDDANEAGISTPPRIPFFGGANRLALRSDYGHYYPKGSLDWIPPSTQFCRLEVDMPCAIMQPDLVNQWLASSCTTLTSFMIRWDPRALTRITDEPTPLSFLRCTALESIRFPIWPFAETLLPTITSSQLAKVILEVNSGDGQDTAKVDDNSWKAIEKDLHSLARRFNDAHPGKKMEVEFRTGHFGDRKTDRIKVLRTLNNRMFMPQLKEEAKVVVPYM